MLQLLPHYHVALDPAFLKWYAAEFTGQRNCFVHTPVCKPDGGDFTEYHQVISEDEMGKPFVFFNTPIAENLYAHTSGRNSLGWAVSIDSFAGASTTNLLNPPTPEMLELAVQQIATDCINMRTPVGLILTHAEAADCVDGFHDPQGPYGPFNGCTRWDFWVGIHPTTLKLVPCFRSDGSPMHYAELASPFIGFGDWLRGEVILKIQATTKLKWRKQ